MKKMTAIVSLLLSVSLLAGCMGTPVVYECDCPTEGENGGTAAPESPEMPVLGEGAVKTGLAILAQASGASRSENEDGVITYDVTAAAVTVDEDGVILSCVIDSVSAEVTFDGSGSVTSNPAAELLTKTELGDRYGMKTYGGAAYEWYEQVGALARYAVGKTVQELREGAINEAGKAADVDLAATATIALGGFVSAIEKAVENAQYLGAQAGDTLRLAVIGSLASSEDAAADKDGTAQLDADVTALTMQGDTITSCVIDSLQAKESFDAHGEITSDLTAPLLTKNELGEQYGMKQYAGSAYEWNEQAAAFAAYAVGKTANEVAGIAVNERTAPTDADLAATVTIAIGGFQALLAKAAR